MRPRVHALSLLRRRLQGLFGSSFRLEVASEVGRGTTVRMRIPLQGRFDIAEESLEATRSGHLVSRARISFIMGIRIRAVIVEDEPLFANTWQRCSMVPVR